MKLKPIFIRVVGGLQKINPEDVVAVAIVKNYTRVYLSNDTYHMVRSTLTNALKKFPPDMFIKVHRSYAASVYFIEFVYKDHLLLNGVTVAIGKRYYNSLVEQLSVIE